MISRTTSLVLTIVYMSFFFPKMLGGFFLYLYNSMLLAFLKNWTHLTPLPCQFTFFVGLSQMPLVGGLHQKQSGSLQKFRQPGSCSSAVLGWRIIA